MKTKINYLFILALAIPWALGAQYVYDDDLYYHPKYESTITTTESSQDLSSLQAEKVTENISDVDINKSSRDIDVYNRRPSYKNEELYADENQEDFLEDSILISQEEYEEFQYSERIRRFHNNKFTTHITEDGYVNIYVEEGANVDIYYMEDNNWNPWMSPWYYDVYYRPYQYGWSHYGYNGYYSPWRFNGWYYGFYDPWYYSWYSPWYHSWGWDPYYYDYYSAYYYTPYTVWGYPSNIKTPRKPINTRTALASRNEVNSRGGVPVSSRQAVGSGGSAGTSATRSAIYNDFSRTETLASTRTANTRGDNITRGTTSSRSSATTARTSNQATRSAVNPVRSSDNSSYRNTTPTNRSVGTSTRQSTTRSTSTTNSSRNSTLSTPSSTRSSRSTVSPSPTRSSSSSSSGTSVRSGSSSSVRSSSSSSSSSSSTSTRSSVSAPSSSSSSSYSAPSSSHSSGSSSGASSSGRSSSGSTGRR